MFLLLLAGMISIGVLAREWREHAVHVTVEIHGTEYASLDALAKLATVPDSSILSDIDLMAIKRKLEQDPFVASAVVRRDPPSNLMIDIVERKPIATLIDVRTKDWFVDRDGVLLPMLPEIPLDDTPVISGFRPAGAITAGTRIRDPRLQQALHIITDAKGVSPDLMNLFSEVSLMEQDDILLYTLESGVPVIFGSADRIESKLRVFRAFWETVAVHRDLSQLEYIDLRFRDQVVARWENDEGATAETAQPDPSTILPD